jgi:1-acyl-sn-glycerol-3-phosphate acyltransferase
MPQPSSRQKPLNRKYRPELTRLPELTEERLRARARACAWSRRIIRRFTRAEVHGLENFPKEGPGLIVANHLGDADMVLGLAYLPVAPDGLGKVELYSLPWLGRWMDDYGIIWVHRGQPDRRAIRAALDGLAQNRFVAIAPEGRQSVTGSLEEGTDGAAYIALKAGVPVIPIAFVGTEDRNVYGSFLRLRRPRMSLTIGAPFMLADLPDRREALARGTERIMRALAGLLPPAYRGVYEG